MSNVRPDSRRTPEEATILAMRAQLMGGVAHQNSRQGMDANRSRRNTRRLTIPRLRPEPRQVREVQPGYADYIGNASGEESRTQAGGMKPWSVFDYSRLLSKRFPPAIYYPITNDTAWVYAILDCHMKPCRTRAILSK
jgi:hypothetical protein